VRRLIGVVAATVAVVLWMVRDVRLADPPRREPVRPTVSASVPPAPAAPATPLLRDPFRFADELPAGPREPLQADPEPVAASAAPAFAPPPVRLSGFVRRGGHLLAVLSVPGGTLVLGEGEEAEGYRVLAIDEEAGVKVRTPDGSEHVLEALP
jgi:hypothetical protein